MAIAEMDKEDVKAGLRKRFGSVARFERTHDLPEKSVSDVLRGRSSARVQAAVEAVFTGDPQSELSEGGSADGASAHRLTAGAR